MTERRLSIIAADATGTARELPCPGGAPFCEPTDWWPDGGHLIVNTRAGAGGTRRDVWSVSIEAGGSSEVILSGPFPQYDARISPDGRWLAYVSEETGRPEVHVRAMSGSRGVSWPPTTAAVSLSGGAMDANCSTSISKGSFAGDRSDSEIERSARASCSRCHSSEPATGARGPDVSPDGQRVYFLDQTPAPRPSDINVAMGWQAFLR